MNVLFFDVETTGLPKKNPATGEVEQPRITQLGFILERFGVDVMTVDALIEPNGWPLHEDPEGLLPPSIISHYATKVTGITPEMCYEQGIPIADAVELFVIAAEAADFIVCHNTAFDVKVIVGEYERLRPEAPSPRVVLCGKPYFCTMKTATPICCVPKKDGKTGNKWPKLEEAVKFFYNEELDGAHSAIVDITATRRVFHTLVGIGAFDEQFEDSVAKGYLPKEILGELADLKAASK